LTFEKEGRRKLGGKGRFYGLGLGVLKAASENVPSKEEDDPWKKSRIYDSG